MSASHSSPSSAPASATDRAFFGHPLGLRTLFFTEMWERFSYYGMRAFLTVFMIASASNGGLGMADGDASLVYGLYGASVYLMSLPGGWIADRFWGQQKAVFVGGTVIMVGHIVLSMPAIPGISTLFAHTPGAAGIPTVYSFYLGLALVVLGTGLLKPNMSTIVGQLYSKSDVRRDAGYTIFYMGINMGALIAPFVCGYLAENDNFRAWLATQGIDPNHSWHIAFGMAAIGMALGLVQYWFTQKHLGTAGMHPNVPSDPVKANADVGLLKIVLAAIFGLPALFVAAVAMDVIAPTTQQVADTVGVGLLIASVVLFRVMWAKARTAGERRRLVPMIVLYVGCIAFFGVFEQAGGLVTAFTKKNAQPTLFGLNFEASYYQGINPAWIVLLAPVFAALWIWLAKRGKEPSAVTKFAIGMIMVMIGTAIMLPTLSTIADGGKVHPLWFFVYYLFATFGELCVSPVGLSSMSKLAPQRLGGMVLGIWFLATSIGYWVAGRAGKVAEDHGHRFLFTAVIIGLAVVAAVLFFISPKVSKMMYTSDEEAGA